MEKIYVDIHPETGLIRGYGSTPMGINSVEVNLERFEDYSKFYECFTSYGLDEEGDLLYIPSAEIGYAKTGKLAEFSATCTKLIMGRFKVTLDAVDYWFSNDMEAQLTFDKMDRAFEKGRVTELLWTVYLADGTVTRILVNADSFELIYTAHLTHIQNNISRFRDLLMPMVMEAETLEEVAALHWDMNLTP